MSDRRIDIDIVGNDQASGVFKKVEQSLSSFGSNAESSLSRLNSGLNRYNTAMNGVHRITQIAMAGAGYAVYNFTKDAINQFADFERQHAKTMGAIATNYDKSTEAQAKFMSDQQKLKQQALSLGTWGPNGQGALYGPTEVASTQTALTKAGFDATKTQGTVEPIIKFAGGNDLGLETATDYAVNLGEIFGVKRDNKSYNEMLNKVTKAADISTVDVPDLFQSLKYAGPIANSLGRSLDETLGVLSVLGNNGLKGSISGTGYQSFLTRILNPIGLTDKAMQTAPTEKVANMAESFVSSTTGPDGKLNSTVDISGKLDEAMGQLNDKEKSWFAYRLFGLYQMKTAYTLGKPGGSDTLKDTVNAISNQSDGAIDKKWDIMLKSGYGVKERLANAYEGMKVDAGYRLEPFTTSIMNELFNVFANKGNYNIDFSKIKDGLKKSSDMVTEQYGKQMGDTLLQLGNLGINTARIGNAVKPAVGGFALGYAELLSGDIPGALKAFHDGISNADENIKKLPPDLQSMAKQVEHAVTTLGILAGINFGARILESITKIGSFLSSISGVKLMNVTASNVVLKDTGLLDKNGNPIYKQESVETTTKNGKSGGGTVVTGGSSKSSDNKPPVVAGGSTPKSTKPTPETVLVDKYGNPITTPTPTAPTKSGTADKIMAGASKATWIYALGEMLGINDFILDKTGAKNGTKSREVIDSGRTAIDWTLTGAFIDSVLLNGAVKSAIMRGFSGGAPKIGTSFATVLGDVVASLGVTGLIAGGATLGAGVVVANEVSEQKKAEDRKTQIDENLDAGRNTYMTNDGQVVAMPSKAEEKVNYDKNKYQYGGGKSQEYITVAEPTKPIENNKLTSLDPTYGNKWAEYNKQLNDYKENLARVDELEKKNKEKFSLAQTVYEKNTGQKLEWDTYQKTKPAWDKLMPDQMFNKDSSFYGPSKSTSEGAVALQPIFQALANLPKGKDGNVDSTALQGALAGIAKDSGQLLATLVSIANSGAVASQSMSVLYGTAGTMVGDMGIISDSASQIATKVNQLPTTGDTEQDAMNAGKVAGQMNGNGFDFLTFATKLDPLNNLSTNSSDILGKLDPINSSVDGMGGKLDSINSSIQSMPPPQVNVAAPNISVNVDKNGNVTTTTSGSYVTQPTTNQEDAWRQNYSRYGGGSR
jgi:TP901 family phage tail tape measure protein